MVAKKNAPRVKCLYYYIIFLDIRLIPMSFSTYSLNTFIHILRKFDINPLGVVYDILL